MKVNCADYLELAEMCKSTYSWYPWKMDPCCEIVEIEEGPTVFYLIHHHCHGEETGRLTCVIRGTDDIWDWLYNIRVGSLMTDGVHEGWYLLYTKIYPKIAEFFNDHHTNDHHHVLSLGGHSLGGAIATLIHRQATHVKGVPLDRVGVFGTPSPFSWRRGPKEAKLPWSQNLVRFVNGWDIVPSILNWRRNYHVGTEVQIGHAPWWKWYRGIADHDMARYVESMNEVIMASTR